MSSLESEPYFLQSLPEEESKSSFLQPNLDGFDELWEATEDSLPKNYRSPLERLLDQQEEQILYLNDAVELLKQENFSLREEMVQIQAVFQAQQKVTLDYANILELNRSLTKQLNSLMSIREREKKQIQALKALLA